MYIYIFDKLGEKNLNVVGIYRCQCVEKWPFLCPVWRHFCNNLWVTIKTDFHQLTIDYPLCPIQAFRDFRAVLSWGRTVNSRHAQTYSAPLCSEPTGGSSFIHLPPANCFKSMSVSIALPLHKSDERAFRVNLFCHGWQAPHTDMSLFIINLAALIMSW